MESEEKMEVDLRQTGMLDSDGFLLEMSKWNRDMAKELAQIYELGPLCEAHWTIIDYVREYFVETGQGPPIVKISKATGLSMKRICTLFPCGVGRGCYRLAGLPRPSGCI